MSGSFPNDLKIKFHNNQPIIHIDDDIVALELVKILYKKANLLAPLLSFSNPEDAYSLFEKNSQKYEPALLLIDINMPKVSGTDFLEKIYQNNEAYFHPTMIVLTGDYSKDLEKKVKNTGAYCLVQKPSVEAYLNFFCMLKTKEIKTDTNVTI